MNKSQFNSTWIEKIYQPKSFETEHLTTFDPSKLLPMCIVINSFVNNLDLSFFKQYYKSNELIGGRPHFDYKVLLKIYLYSLYRNISIRNLSNFNSPGSNLHYLSQGLSHFPERTEFFRFLKILDLHINDIFDLSIEYICKQIELDLLNLYDDGTFFEAHNNRHKIITDTNISRSNKKWTTIREDPNSSEDLKSKASKKLELNKERTLILSEFNRTSYGRTDNDSVLLKDKNGSYIAGYNVQFVEEGKYGLIVYAYISNKNPDSAVFLDMVEPLIKKYKPKSLTMDLGYGTTDILEILTKNDVTPIVKTLKSENATKKITDYSFELSENEDYLICPVGQFLEKVETKVEDKVAFKAENCQLCDIKDKCLDKSKNKRVTINIEEFKALKLADKSVNSPEGEESYSHRGNKCESPNGFIKYNLGGKKLKMDGLIRNNTIIQLYACLYNLRRLISIKSSYKK
ncbi:MAG: transposase [Oscillospiraceae bacterium]|nr:transposase [Oscillospiraceae bacterium]